MKRYCPKNHDTWIVGRDKTSTCKECEKERHLRRLQDPIYRLRYNALRRLRRNKQTKEKLNGLRL